MGVSLGLAAVSAECHLVLCVVVGLEMYGTPRWPMSVLRECSPTAILRKKWPSTPVNGHREAASPGLSEIPEASGWAKGWFKAIRSVRPRSAAIHWCGGVAPE